nr:immunoglobulin light chain junction region [Macaca mulatta]
CMQGLEFPTF